MGANVAEAARPNDGNTAFPTRGPHRDSEGMTLRDYFAASALQGFMSNSDIPDMLKKGFKPDGAAEACYMIADAMIAEREKNR
jgi:hypothetical protein